MKQEKECRDKKEKRDVRMGEKREGKGDEKESEEKKRRLSEKKVVFEHFGLSDS